MTAPKLLLETLDGLFRVGLIGANDPALPSFNPPGDVDRKRLSSRADMLL
jgi:hypothetical protein